MVRVGGGGGWIVGGGGGGGGGAWMILIYSGFLMTSMALLARPLTSA